MSRQVLFLKSLCVFVPVMCLDLFLENQNSLNLWLIGQLRGRQSFVWV